MRPLWLKDPETGKVVEIPYQHFIQLGPGGDYVVDCYAVSQAEAVKFVAQYPRFFKFRGPGFYVLRKKRQSWLGYQFSIMTQHGQRTWMLIAVLSNALAGMLNLFMILAHWN